MRRWVLNYITPDGREARHVKLWADSAHRALLGDLGALRYRILDTLTDRVDGSEVTSFELEWWEESLEQRGPRIATVFVSEVPGEN